MPQNELLLQFAKVIRKEMEQWKESFTYQEIEVFVGSCLADLLANKLITQWEESVLREKILGD